MMNARIVTIAIGGAVLLVSLSPTCAQAQAHQMPGTAPGAGADTGSCGQNSQAVTRTLDAANARIEDARQSNDAATLRAAVGDLQVAFAQIKTQLADCVALAAGGGTVGNMAGMDHSKMQMAPPGSTASTTGAKAAAPMAGMDHSKMAGEKSAPAAAGAPANAAPAAVVTFTVRTDPAPPRSGTNDFEVTLKDAEGKPIIAAAVSVAFYRPPMPSMNMPEMRAAAQLTSAGGGVYKGSATIGMSGDWDVTITVTRKGQTLGTKKIKLAVK